MTVNQFEATKRITAWWDIHGHALMTRESLSIQDLAKQYISQTGESEIGADEIVIILKRLQVPADAEADRNGENPLVVLSGIRATGRMHLGNYLGALERFAVLSSSTRFRCLFFVADLHTLTTHKLQKLIREQAPEIVLDMLGAGVDPDRSTIYAQSYVPVVTELAWYLSCIVPTGELQRMPTFKEKSRMHADDVNAGLLNYPVLMAADILGPRANLVPVGDDQRPHLELTRDIARRFNQLYGRFFPTPHDFEESVLLPGLFAADEDGHFGKMGKSEKPESTIYLNDSWDVSLVKLKRSPTDPARMRRNDPGTPQKCVIYALHSSLSSVEQLRTAGEGCRTAAISCLECKEVLAGNIKDRIAAFWDRRRTFAEKPEMVREILQAGAKTAKMLFDETTNEVADRMGVMRPRTF